MGLRGAYSEMIMTLPPYSLAMTHLFFMPNHAFFTDRGKGNHEVTTAIHSVNNPPHPTHYFP
jgi:hypothetical protein